MSPEAPGGPADEAEPSGAASLPVRMRLMRTPSVGWDADIEHYLEEQIKNTKTEICELAAARQHSFPLAITRYMYRIMANTALMGQRKLES